MYGKDENENDKFERVFWTPSRNKAPPTLGVSHVTETGGRKLRTTRYSVTLYWRAQSDLDDFDMFPTS